MRKLTLLSLAVVLTFTPATLAAQDAAQKEALAKTANPELVGALAKELDATPAQAEGAAGSLFSLAKSRLSADDWSKVAKSVPGIDGLLLAAPQGAIGTTGAMGAIAGKAGGLTSAASAFSKLGLKPELVGKAVPVLTGFVGKTGGADVAKLLGGVLK
jgi:hypothetical protein